VCCNTIEHICSLNGYTNQIANACLSSANEIIPISRCRGARGCIPGWSESIAPLRSNSLFWHRMWVDYGRPHDGVVAEVMRKTRAQYHAAIRKARKNEADIVNERFAAALSENRSRDFWKEVKRIRGRSSNISNTVDEQSSAVDIANMFASRYSDLYTSVLYDVEDMQSIRD